MIDIYTERKGSKDWIFYNDLYFNLNTGNEDMSQKEIDLIQQVDEAKLTPDKHIETKYGLGTIRNLSSGCKTLLNIVKHHDKVVNVEECGPNVLRIIFTMDNIKIYMSTLIMKMGNVIEILKKIKWLKSEYSKKKLSKERRLKSFLKNEYFKVSLNEVSRDLKLSETL